MSDLSVDVVSDILSRLPVKTLLQFRCVSKPWCALIDSPTFIKLHLNQSLQSNSNLSLILSGEELYTIDLNSPNEVVELNHPLKCYRRTLVMGSCNGLLLLFNNETGIAIWNPSTREYHKLPDTPTQSPNYTRNIRYMTYGFGYDCIHDDYKVLRIVQYYYEECDIFSSEVKIYSLKSNSWKRVQDLPYYLCLRCEWGVLAGGALHWIGKQRPDPNLPKFIVAFDIEVEEYRLVPQPEYLDGCFSVKGVDVLKGCLCITCSYHKDRVDVWVMKDYGVKESWTKMLSVVPPRLLSCEFVKPLAYSSNGGEILFGYDDKRFLWYDLSGKFVKEVIVHGIPYSFHQEVFVGSLIRLDAFGQISGGKQLGQEKRKENKNKKRDDFLSEGFKLVL